ncbi:unnamed protein product [Closterium sp. NIES-64]|nr:unnamed protein product [Closterium sp. NIES-64]
MRRTVGQEWTVKQQQQQQGRRAFCVECHKATSVCICDRFGEPVDNRVGVTILQHPKEKYHPLGSARIALLGLQRVRVVVVPLGPGRPGLQPKDPCSRRSLLGRSGRGRWRKGAGKAQGQGGKQGEGAGEEQGQGQGNGQGHGQGPELGADQGKGEGHGQEQGQGQGKGLGETQGNAEGRMLQEGEEAPQQRLWGDQAQRTGESSERGNARDGEASTGIDGGLVVVTAVGEKVEVRGGKLHEVEEREGEVREGEECVENGVEQEGSRGVGANGPVLGEQQGGETANGASTGDSSFDLSFDLLPFAAADGAESDDGRGDHHADGSSAVDGGGMWCEDNIEYGTKGLASTACGCLSTIEAVVYALQILEPDNRVKLDELLEVFNSMVIDQPEIRAYKLGKQKCSYNQVELVFLNEDSRSSKAELSLTEAIEMALVKLLPESRATPLLVEKEVRNATVCWEDAAEMLLDPPDDRSRIRRLYDVVNILSSINLIEKVQEALATEQPQSTIPNFRTQAS